MLCGTRDAERRAAQRSTAQHSTCKQHMHDRDTVHAHAHVSCTVVPSCLELPPRTVPNPFCRVSCLSSVR